MSTPTTHPEGSTWFNEGAAGFVAFVQGIGDRDAQWRRFDDVIRMPLDAYCTRLLLDLPSEVDDAVQETLLRVLVHAGKAPVDAVDSLRKWIYTIAYRVCMAILRNPRNRHGLLEGVDVPTGAPGAATRLRKRDGDAAVRAALGSLPKEERVPLRLHEQRGRTFDTIARRCGRSRKQVRRAIEHGRARLRRKLEEAGLTP